MDDCTLKKLNIKPGKLSPTYKKDVLEYNVTVGSNIAKITFDCETNDTGASTQIKVGYIDVGCMGTLRNLVWWANPKKAPHNEKKILTTIEMEKAFQGGGRAPTLASSPAAGAHDSDPINCSC